MIPAPLLRLEGTIGPKSSQPEEEEKDASFYPTTASPLALRLGNIRCSPTRSSIARAGNAEAWEKNLHTCISLFAFPLPRAHTAAADPAWSPLGLPGHMEKEYRQQQEKGDAVKKQLKGMSRCKASAVLESNEAVVEEKRIFPLVGWWVSVSSAMQPLWRKRGFFCSLIRRMMG